MGLFSKSPKLKTFSTLDASQQPVSQRLGTWFAEKLGQPTASYTGQRVAGMSPYEQSAMNRLSQYQSNLGAYMPQQQAQYAKQLGGQTLAPVDMNASRQFWEQNVVPQYQQRFQQMAAPALEQAKAMGAGVSSSGMNRALAEQAGNMSMTLGQQGTQFMMDEQAAQRQRDELNAQYAAQAMQSGDPQRAAQLASAQAGLQYGQLPRLLEQATNDAAYQEWTRNNPDIASMLQMAMQYIQNPQLGGYMKAQPGALATMTGQVGEINSLDKALGPAAAGLGMLLA